MYDHESEEKNMEKYGQPTPPEFDIDNIKDFNIVMVCGLSDLVTSKKDYDWVKNRLAPTNKLTFMQFEEGHLGLLISGDEGTKQIILDQILSFKDDDADKKE